MITVSIRLPDSLLNEVDKIAKDLNVPRTAYLRQAIVSMNSRVKEEKRRARIMKLSRRVRKESMRVNSEFSGVENDLDA